MGMACVPMSVFFGHSDAFGHLQQCLRVTETKQLPGTALVLLMDRAPWPVSSFLWCCGGHQGEQVCTKTKFLILVSIAKKKRVILLPLLIVTFLCLRRKTNPRINIWLGWPILCWSPPHVGGGTSISRFPCCVLSYFSLVIVVEHSRRWWLHIGGSKMLAPHFKDEIAGLQKWPFLAGFDLFCCSFCYCDLYLWKSHV